MKTENKQTQISQQAQGFIANPQVYLNEEKGTMTHVLTDSVRIVMPINLYKQILGIPFTKKEKEGEPQATPSLKMYGLFARPSIYLSKDGKYLVHKVLGVRVTKHVNYYKAILSQKDEQLATESVA